MNLNPPTPEAIAACAAAMLAGENLFAGVKNEYGNYDGKKELPTGLVTITQMSNAKLWAACRSMGIPGLKILNGFSGSRKHGWKPDFNGAVIRASDWERLCRKLFPDFEQKRRVEESWQAVLERRAAERSLDLYEDERAYA